MIFSKNVLQREQLSALDMTTPPRREEAGDALLFLGPKSSLTRSRLTPDRFNAGDVRELERLHQLIFGLQWVFHVLFELAAKVPENGDTGM